MPWAAFQVHPRHGPTIEWPGVPTITMCDGPAGIGAGNDLLMPGFPGMVDYVYRNEQDGP